MIPAAQHVCRDGRFRLRVDYDDIVQLSDLVVTSSASKLVSKIPSKCVKKQLITILSSPMQSYGILKMTDDRHACVCSQTIYPP